MSTLVAAARAQEPDEPFTLSAQEEDELLAAIAEIERGEFMSDDELFKRLVDDGAEG